MEIKTKAGNLYEEDSPSKLSSFGACRRSESKSLIFFNLEKYTWCHSSPLEAPAMLRAATICFEVDIHCVCSARNYWRLEIAPCIWTTIRIATPFVHEERPVPISDFDEVTGTGLVPPNFNRCEL